MNPSKSKKLLKMFNQVTDGKRHTTKVGDSWIYTEDIESGLREIYNLGAEDERRRIMIESPGTALILGN